MARIYSHVQKFHEKMAFLKVSTRFPTLSRQYLLVTVFQIESPYLQLFQMPAWLTFERDFCGASGLTSFSLSLSPQLQSPQLHRCCRPSAFIPFLTLYNILYSFALHFAAAVPPRHAGNLPIFLSTLSLISRLIHFFSISSRFFGLFSYKLLVCFLMCNTRIDLPEN